VHRRHLVRIDGERASAPRRDAKYGLTKGKRRLRLRLVLAEDRGSQPPGFLWINVISVARAGLRL
jgi:hypothetical protein